MNGTKLNAAGLMLLATLMAPGCASVPGYVVSQPTFGDALPPAILGESPPPRGRSVAYFPESETTRGYWVQPVGLGKFPTVLLIHEWDGLTARMKQIADAFAREGYAALAADLYGGRTGSSPEENRDLVQDALADEEVLIRNLNSAVSYIRSQSVTTGKVATVGWCFGGGVALSFALGGDRHEGTAIFYGRLLDDPMRMRHIDHEIYGTFVADDPGIPAESVDRFVKTLRAIGIPNDVHIYDDVRHGFWLHVDQNPETNIRPARDAWVRLKGYLRRTLGSRPYLD